MTYKGIKFKTKIISKNLPRGIRLETLKHWCKIFHDKGLAPYYEGGSYGNLSYRLEEGKDEFVITASNSSLKDSISDDRFTVVHNVNINGIVSYSGTRKPSSEAMLHYRIYNKRKDIGAIFHGHCPEISLKAEKLGIPITKKQEHYGTLKLVNSVLDILNENNFIEMKNHGFLSLCNSMTEAGSLTLEVYDKCK